MPTSLSSIVGSNFQGAAGSITGVSSTTINPNVNPSVSNTGTPFNANLVFSLPRAPTFSVGSVSTLTAGNNATVSNVGANGDITLNFGIPQGPAATISVGTVTTLSAGQSATVTNVGTSSAAVLNFAIPQGNDGGGVTTGKSIAMAIVFG